MPAYRLNSKGAEIQRYDAIGSDSSAKPRFVTHAALALDDTSGAVCGATLPVAHMKPPHVPHGRAKAHVFGTVPLTVDEQKIVSLFIEEVEEEREAGEKRSQRSGLFQYTVHPHCEEVTESDGTPIYRRFSCVGYVLGAYGEAGVKPLDTEPENLPEVEEASMKMAYPELYQHLHRRPNARQGLSCVGLDGTGPWRVVLPGYLFHAMNRPQAEIRSAPYQAVEGNEVFP